jgi:hypothetical protein
MCNREQLLMAVAGDSKGRLARMLPRLGLLLTGAVALTAWGAPVASAGPAEEEYKLQIPDARGGSGGGGESASPGEARSLLGGGSSSSFSGTSSGRPSGSPLRGAGSWGSGGYGGGAGGEATGSEPSAIDEALLAKAREDDRDAGLVSAASAAGKTPLGLTVAGALLLVALAGLLAARRHRGAKIGTPD